MKKNFLSIVLVLGILINVYGQSEKIVKAGIVNGSASYLPKPDYPQEAKDFCAQGQVEVEVLMSEEGKAIEAKAISGDEFLRTVSVEAAKKAVFRQMVVGVPVKKKGIVVYNFVSEKKCIEKGIVNDRALKLPKPQLGSFIHPEHLRISKDETIQVRVIIDLWTGEVTRARSVSGHPLLRAACENAARQAKFAPFGHGPRIFVKAILAYKFKPNGKIETDFKEEKAVVGNPINLVKPKALL